MSNICLRAHSKVLAIYSGNEFRFIYLNIMELHVSLVTVGPRTFYICVSVDVNLPWACLLTCTDIPNLNYKRLKRIVHA